MIACDCQDLLAYLMGLSVIKERWISTLRKNVSDLYFLECVGWLLYYGYQYAFPKEKKEGRRTRERLILAKYVLDCLTSFNDFSCNSHPMNSKLAASLGFLSSVMNLCLIWK